MIQQGRHATNDASIMCSNGGVGHGVGCGGFDGSNGGVDDNVAKGLQAVVKQYSTPLWLNQMVMVVVLVVVVVVMMVVVLVLMSDD